jgi:hypothetical protein
MKFTVNLSQQDWVAYNQHLIKNLPKTHKTWLDNQYLMIALWFFLGLAVMFIFDLSKNFNPQTAFAVSLFFVVLIAEILLNTHLKRKVFYPNPKGGFVGEHHFTFDEFGIQTSGNGYHAHHAWKLVQKIERIDNGKQKHILLYLDTAYAFIFPENQLENAENFHNIIQQYFLTKNQLKFNADEIADAIKQGRE